MDIQKIKPLVYCFCFFFTTSGLLKAQTKTDIGPANKLPVLVDIDGNDYKVVKIGAQVWMAENLKVTRYRNGDPIPEVRDFTEWMELRSGGYCWYDNDENAFKGKYGAMYNFYAVADKRHLCPAGWHVPTKEEWDILRSFLGGASIAGGKIKEAGTLHWESPNEGATNESGFSARPAGHRDNNAMFSNDGKNGDWWSSTEATEKTAWTCGPSYKHPRFSPAINDVKTMGFAVRCLKD